jgi:hypothetical protein
VHRLPLIDWEGLLSKPPLILRNVTKFAAFALLSADSYADDVMSGRRNDLSIRSPGALFELGPVLEFTPELLPLFRSWVVSCAFRDSVELVLKHLDDIRDILAICSLPPETDPDTAAWYERVVKEGQEFHRWFLSRKLDRLKTLYGFTPSDDLALFLTISHARNCLVHRDGIVFDEDADETGSLTVRWRAPRASVVNPGVPPRVISEPGAQIDVGGWLEIQDTVRAKTFGVGKRIEFTSQELNEIGSFLSVFTSDLSMRTQARARDLVGLPSFRSPNSTSPA